MNDPEHSLYQVRLPDPSRTAKALHTSDSGLSFVEAIASGKLAQAPFEELLGIKVSDVSHGKASFTCQPEERHFNILGDGHGGLFASILDSAMGWAVQSVLPAGQRFTTTDLHCRLIRPLTPESGPVNAKGWVVNAGRKVIVAEAELTNKAGKLCARGSSSCLVIDL